MFVNYLGTVFSVLTSLVLRVFIPPKVFGIISVVTGIQNYFEMINVMFRNSIDREVPYYRAKNKPHIAKLITDLSISTLILLLTVQSIILVVFGLYADSVLMTIAWVAMAVSLPFLSLGTTYKILLKSQLNLKSHNSGYLFGSTIGNLLLILCSIIDSQWGYFLGYTLSALVQFYFFRYSVSLDFILFYGRSRLVRVAFKKIIFGGGAIAFFSLINQMVITVDRYFIVGAYGLEEVGGYSLAGLVMMKVFELPKMAIGIYMPKLMGHIAAKKNDQIGKQNSELKLLFVSLSCIIAITVNYSIDFLITKFLPAYYLNYSVFIKLLLIGSVVWTLKNLSQQVIVAFKKTRRSILSNGIVLLIEIIFFYYLIVTKAPLVYYAYGTLISIILITIMSYVSESKILGRVFWKDYKVFIILILYICGALLTVMNQYKYLQYFLMASAFLLSSKNMLNFYHKYVSK